MFKFNGKIEIINGDEEVEFRQNPILIRISVPISWEYTTIIVINIFKFST